MTSIYYYKGLVDFRLFIRNIVEKSRTISDVLAEFREINVLPKRLGQLTVEQTTHKIIEEIYNALLKMQPETRYNLPYDKKERESEIISNITRIFDIDSKFTFSKILVGHYKDDNTGQQFPWGVEIVMARRNDLDHHMAGEINFIGSVNDTPAIDGGEKYFQSDQHAYRWKDRKGGYHSVRSAKQVLHENGFSQVKTLPNRRHASVVYINVKTNVPDWLGAAGKTHMNQVPYAETIANTLYSMSQRIPTYRGQGHAQDRSSISKDNEWTATDYVDEFLKDRLKLWKQIHS